MNELKTPGSPGPHKHGTMGFDHLKMHVCPIPIGSMYGIFPYIYHKKQLNVGKYTIHASYGIVKWAEFSMLSSCLGKPHDHPSTNTLHTR